jgi:hypothetical protein
MAPGIAGKYTDELLASTLHFCVVGAADLESTVHWRYRLDAACSGTRSRGLRGAINATRTRPTVSPSVGAEKY